MDKCEGCPMSTGLDFPEAGRCGRLECHLTSSDFTSIEAAIAGKGRLVLHTPCETCGGSGNLTDGFGRPVKCPYCDDMGEIISRQDQGGE